MLKRNSHKTKFIIVTGGVLSGLGKGVAAASLGFLLKKNMRIVPIKCDGYLNTDPGTMNPIEHGEVFVLDDGGEVDMDFGHYERFLGVNCKSNWNITMGKVYQQILENERKGIYLGKTVQLIPHVTDEIKRRIKSIVNEENAELALIEIGGTIGDMEIALFVEAMRQLRFEVGRENIMFVHLTYVPIPSGVNEQKSKPTQTSVKLLNQAGIYPDMIICRCKKRITEQVRDKIAMMCNMDSQMVVSGIDVDPIYDLPVYFEAQHMSELVHKYLNIYSPPDLGNHIRLVKTMKKNLKSRDNIVNIAICGKYTNLEDSYASIIEALQHCGAHLDVRVKTHFIETTDITKDNLEEHFVGVDGVIVPGGFGVRGLEGKILTIQYLRENKIPFMGICLGMQLAVIEFARNVCGINDAITREVEKDGYEVKEPVIDILPEQVDVTQMGGTMRLGGQDVEIVPKTQAHKIYRSKMVRKRFRHRYEVNPEYIERLEEKGLVFSGRAPGREIMQIMELADHPFFMASQFHPELTSRLDKPSVMFYHFVKASYEVKNK